MPKTKAQTSTQNVFKNQANYTRALNGMWRMSRNAPMYSKVVVNEKTGKETTRHTRLLNNLAYKIAVSGACAGVSGALENDLETIGCAVLEDSKTRPFACTLAPGAAMAIEQFLASVVKQVTYHTISIRNGLKKHSRINKAMAKIAIAEVKKSMFDPASGLPLTTTVLPLVLARKKRDGEAEAPGDVEAADPQAEAAEAAEEASDAEDAEDAEAEEEAEEE